MISNLYSNQTPEGNQDVLSSLVRSFHVCAFREGAFKRQKLNWLVSDREEQRGCKNIQYKMNMELFEL